MIWFFHCRWSSGNLRNRHTVDFVKSAEKLKNFAPQPSFKQSRIFHKNLVTVDRAKVELTLNQPIYVGFAILDLSKRLMWDFCYNYIKRKYPDSASLFSDTDYLTYQIQMDKVHEDLYADKHLFSFSGYEKKPILQWWKQKSNGWDTYEVSPRFEPCLCT